MKADIVSFHWNLMLIAKLSLSSSLSTTSFQALPASLTIISLKIGQAPEMKPQSASE